jgi:hypothetical protein
MAHITYLNDVLLGRLGLRRALCYVIKKANTTNYPYSAPPQAPPNPRILYI